MGGPVKPVRFRQCRVVNAAASTSLLVLVLLAGGCVSQAPVPEAPAVEPSSDPPHPAEPPRAAPDPGTPLILLVNDPDLRDVEIVQVFSAKLRRPYEIYNLAHRSRDWVIEALGERSPVTVVALGTAAHDLARAIPGLEVIHAGVLRPDPSFRGVDALPSFALQLDHWQSLAPGLRRVGVLGSPGMKTRMSELAAAAADRGLTLEQRIVHSDTESVLAFRAMVPHIDGFVFLPDEAVLSPRVIQQMLNHGRQNGVQMLVYSPLMYNLGASLFVQPDPVRVASALIDMLADTEARPEVTRMRTRSRLEDGPELTASAPNPATGR